MYLILKDLVLKQIFQIDAHSLYEGDPYSADFAEPNANFQLNNLTIFSCIFCFPKKEEYLKTMTAYFKIVNDNLWP